MFYTDFTLKSSCSRSWTRSSSSSPKGTRATAPAVSLLNFIQTLINHCCVLHRPYCIIAVLYTVKLLQKLDKIIVIISIEDKSYCSSCIIAEFYSDFKISLLCFTQTLLHTNIAVFYFTIASIYSCKFSKKVPHCINIQSTSPFNY